MQIFDTVHKEGWASSQPQFRRRRNAFTAVSYFSGCGGLDLGLVGGFAYRDQLFPPTKIQVIKAFDINPDAVATYNLNIGPHASVADISALDPADVPSADIVAGGFPCQDFASCGPRRGLNSSRGRLYRTLIDYAELHRPLLIVGENVPGLATMDKGRVLQLILDDIAAAGYRPHVWRLYAPDYGIPQTRSRLIIVGVRADLPTDPRCPERTHQRDHRSIQWAISDLVSVIDDRVPNQSQYFKAAKAKKGNGQGDEVSRHDAPGYTVRANAKSRVQFHYSLDRRLTVRECARLQSFPDQFQFLHSATSNIMQIGNAVPPVLGHVVGSALSEWMSELQS